MAVAVAPDSVAVVVELAVAPAVVVLFAVEMFLVVVLVAVVETEFAVLAVEVFLVVVVFVAQTLFPVVIWFAAAALDLIGTAGLAVAAVVGDLFVVVPVGLTVAGVVFAVLVPVVQKMIGIGLDVS